MDNKVINEILDIAKDAGMKTEPITLEMIKPLLDIESGDICKRCNKWFFYDYTQKPGELPIILNSNEEYCSKLCKEIYKEK